MSKSKQIELAIETWQQNNDASAAETILALTQEVRARMVSFRSSGNYDYDDLMSESSIGVLNAASRFDLKTHNANEFLNYAWHWIRKSIDRSKSRYAYIWYDKNGHAHVVNRNLTSQRKLNDIPDNRLTESIVLNDDIDYAIHHITNISNDKRRNIIVNVLLHGDSQTDTAKNENVSKALVSQYLRETINNLRRNSRQDGTSIQTRRIHANESS